MNLNIEKSLFFEISYLSAKLRGDEVKVLRMGQGQLIPLILHSIRLQEFQIKSLVLNSQRWSHSS